MNRAGTSPWAPLAQPSFRLLMAVHLGSTICVWMNDVAAAWIMTSLTASPAMVALVQSAATLPIFLIGLPGGALADMFDRRRCLLATQIAAGLAALATCLVLASGRMTPHLLLALTFANGLALSMRWPVLSALVPESVPRTLLQSSMALVSVGFNASRVIGPLLAGLVIGGFGSIYVFALSAAVSAASTAMILLWRRPPQAPPASPRERVAQAILTGVRHVWQSPRMCSLLLRVAVFFLHVTALIALLPLVARQMHGAGPNTFTTLLAAMGLGAVVSLLFVLPRARLSVSSDLLLGAGAGLLSGAMVLAALAPNVGVAIVALVCAGVAWTTVSNSLTVLLQLALPDAVRARGMSIHLVTMMGGTALGAALWGQVASHTSVAITLCLAAASLLACWWAMRKQRLGHAFGGDAGPHEPL